MTSPRYAEYKDSASVWLGPVPAHWQVRRLGFYFEERREKVSDKDYPPLSVTKAGVVPQLDTAAKTDDGDNRKRVCAGDFVINSRSDRKGSAGIAPVDGSVSLISTVLRPLGGVDGRFAHQLLRSVPFQEEFYRFGKGIVADLWSTNYSEMRNIALALPPLREQKLIAAFLDRETAKIAALIAGQEKLIALLAEKRRATISHAVTRGLKSDTPMKDSGVSWLGEMPVHWIACHVRRVLESIQQGWSPECFSRPAEGSEWGVLKSGCVNGGTFNVNENKALPGNLEPDPQIEVCDGDLLMSRASGSPALVGATAYVSLPPPRLMLSDKVFRLNLQPHMLPQFFAVAFGARYMRDQIEQAISGAEGLANNLPQASLKSFTIAVPPLKEQRQLVTFIESETAMLDGLKAEAQRAITLLKERRAALIAAAVTGRIDVRGQSSEVTTAELVAVA
jgi:type I restriction enzyme, S subunit